MFPSLVLLLTVNNNTDQLVDDPSEQERGTSGEGGKGHLEGGGASKEFITVALIRTIRTLMG